jgi:aryl-alcohol dehydrogenase-like predicted oxidoreductase
MIIAVNNRKVQLGLGMVGIGKPWGVAPHAPPSEREAIALLEFAYDLGIRYFDTAPSYGDGVSEERLGRFLLGALRSDVIVATKFGEHWDASKGVPYADHSFDALRRSLDRSCRRLGRIDILHLHKTTPEALAGSQVARAWEYAVSLGIGRIGPSASDLQSARLAIADWRYRAIQLPYNAQYRLMEPAIADAAARGVWVAVNRPFAMGAMAGDRHAAFRFILRQPFEGVILSGTTSPEHLRENWEAFQKSNV